MWRRRVNRAADVNHRALYYGRPPVVLPHVPEVFQPTIHRGVANPPLASVVASNELQLRFPGYDQQFLNGGGVFLSRRDNATQAYVLDPVLAPIDLGNNQRGLDWGTVFFAVVCTVTTDHHNVFDIPDPQNQQRVAIKRLKKCTVDAYLANRGSENPFKEMARMEQLGDNEHVLMHVEFLQDDEYIYIITPKGRTLSDELNRYTGGQSMPRARVHEIFQKILKINEYLESVGPPPETIPTVEPVMGISHRDFKAENLLILQIDGIEKLLLFDFAMSEGIPVNPETGHCALIEHHGNFGTPPYIDPIVFQPGLLPGFRFDLYPGYDGVASNLYSSGIILYRLFTNHVLFDRPVPSDRLYEFYLLAGGLLAGGVLASGLFPPLPAAAEVIWQQISVLCHDALALYNVLRARTPGQLLPLGPFMNVAATVNADFVPALLAEHQIRHRRRIHATIPPAIMLLLMQMLNPDPRERISLQEVMASDWVVNGPDRDVL